MTKTNKIWLGAFSVLILILITTFIWLSFSKPSSGNDLSQVDFTVTADKKAGDYVQKESQFIIQPTAKVSKKDLEESLSIEPAIDFQIKKDSQGFIIKPQEELALNTIYNISIKQKASQPPLSFAFQTIGDFQVVSSLPCNEARWVPTNSGIEISFSHQLSDIDKFFQIEPQTAGTFQKNQKTITFIPQSDLKANIIYTVTIKAGLTANNGDKLKEDYIFKFRTDNGSKWSGENFFSPQTGLTESFLSDDKVILEFSASENFTGKEFITDIYKVKDSAEYLDLAAKTQKQIHPVLGEISDAKISPQGLPKLSSFASTLQRNGQYDWLPTFIMLPQNPGLGYYLLDTYNKENPQIRCQKLIQISDIALYTESSNGKTLFWANDTKSQQPLAKATIQITNGEQKINQNFQADGTVIIENKELEAGSLLIKNGKQEFADYLDFHKAQKASPSEDYYAYVYTDREAYQPTDNILFWGMIIPRKDAPMPKNIHLDWQDGGQNPNGLEIELKADGSFQGKLPLNKHSSQYMSLDFFLPQDKNNKDKVLASKGIQIMEYIKPAYTIEPQYDKDFFRHGEKISGTILGSFFDGTPAANLLLERYVNQKDDTAQKILLDAQGKNTFSFPVTEKHESWDPYQITMNLQTVSPEDESSYISTPILYFPSDYLLKAEDIGDNAAGLQLELKSYQIDFSKVNKDTQIYDSDFSDKIKGAPAEIKGKIAIYHNYYTKKQTGTYYDFIDKLNKPFYEYVHHEEIVKEIPFATQNGTYKTSLLPYKNTGVENYYAKVIYSNPDNTSFTQTIYPKSYFNAPNSYMITEYYFDFPQKGYNYQALENEKVNVQLMNNLGIAKEKGHLLYTIHQQGIMSQTIIDKNSFDLTFSKEYIPNINIYGAFFDGKHIYPVRNNTLGFKTDDQKLKIEIKKEDKLYAPGSDAELQFKVTDQAGKAVSASMVVSIVDEAAFAVQDQQISLLENLYQQVYFYPVATSASYIPHDMNKLDSGGAEGGGDGDADGIRKDFADTADFISVNSNSKGEASVKVHFPDNLTSWRISSLAISSDVKAGYAKENIQVGRDFFIHPLISANYLEGDDLAFSLRSFGKKANNQQDVNYTISMTGPKGEQKINLQGKPDQYIQGNLGKMPKGQYKIVFTAQQGENKDAIEKTVNISDTLLEIPVWEKTTPEKLKDLQVNKYPVNLLLYDSQNELYFSALSQLWQEGSRADQQLAKQLALDKLQKTAQGDLQLTDNYNPQSIQPFSGGIILLPYSEEDPLLTAKACAVAGPYIDTDLAKNYFSNIVNHSLDAETAKNRKIDYNKLTAAYFGLAALKEPVLDDIQDLLNNAPNLDFEQKLNLALGLAYIGDSQTASAWYDANISPLLIEQKPWKYLKKGEDQDYNYYLTGQALMLAVKINHPDTEALLTYLLDNKSDKYLVLMEIMSYVNLFDSAPTPAAYSYNLNGENTKGDFHENSYLTLSLGEKQLKEANIQATKGEIGIRAFYNGKLSAVEKDKSASLSLEKSLQADNLQTGNGVKINFHIKFAPDAPYGSYIISDSLPSGIRYRKTPQPYDNHFQLLHREGQKIQLIIYRPAPDLKKNQKPLMEMDAYYYGRAVLPGEFKMDNAVIRHDLTSMTAIAPGKTIVIK